MSAWDLRQGDCVAGLAGLQDKSVDVVITDPPYSERLHEQSKRAARAEAARGMDKYKRQGALGFAALTLQQIDLCSWAFARLAKRWVVVFGDDDSAYLWRRALERAGLEVCRTSVWIRRGGAPQFTGDRPAVGHECIVIAHPPGKKRWNGGGRPGVYEFPVMLQRSGKQRRIHTTQKPESLMEAVIADFTEPDEMILDPFAGSATTGVATVKLGRRFLGWEIDTEAHALAALRLEGTHEQTNLFRAPARTRKPKQASFA